VCQSILSSQPSVLSSDSETPMSDGGKKDKKLRKKSEGRAAVARNVNQEKLTYYLSGYFSMIRNLPLS
jgi:hypothetical protein